MSLSLSLSVAEQVAQVRSLETLQEFESCFVANNIFELKPYQQVNFTLMLYIDMNNITIKIPGALYHAKYLDTFN